MLSNLKTFLSPGLPRALVTLAFLFSGCQEKTSPENGPESASETSAPTDPVPAPPDDPGPRPAPGSDLRFVFNGNFADWRAGFAEYATETADMMELEASISQFPPELGDGRGYSLKGTNFSDDLFMYIYLRLGREDGVRPGAFYRVSFRIRFASKARSGCAGIGGPPGEAVYLKAGASDRSPAPVLIERENSFWITKIDKGNQAEGGREMQVVSNIANGVACEDPHPEEFVSLVRESGELEARASRNGEIWLAIGTDSGFEGTTQIYYQEVEVLLTPRIDDASGP